METHATPQHVYAQNRLGDLTLSSLNDPEKQTLLELALAVLAAAHQPGTELTSPKLTRAYLRLLLADRKHEVFGCVFLDNKHCVLSTAEMFQGTVDGAAVYPRVVVQQALAINASAVLLFHNHPSGVAEPSPADRAVTQRLQAALALVDVRVLDHFVVATCGSVSFAESGWL